MCRLLMIDDQDSIDLSDQYHEPLSRSMLGIKHDVEEIPW